MADGCRVDLCEGLGFCRRGGSELGQDRRGELLSILLVLLTFLLIVVSGYLRRQKAQCAVARVEVRTSPGQTREDTFAIPPGYCFHPSHTWVVSEGQENARVGLDNLVTCLFGEINHIEVIGLERWVRESPL